MKLLKEKQLAKDLLKRLDLPISDLDSCQSLKMYAEQRDGSLCGVVGYELYDSDILLRSLAVDPDCRGEGLGSDLLAYAEKMAVKEGAKTVLVKT